MINVLLINKQTLIREGTKLLLLNTKNIHVIAEINDAEAAISFFRASLKTTNVMYPDIILFDVNKLQPVTDAINNIHELLKTKPDLKIIIVSENTEYSYSTLFLKAGVVGYLSKNNPFDEMVQAINKVYNGQRYLSPEITQQIAFKSVISPVYDTPPFASLSEREEEVMMLVVKSMSIPEISEELDLSPKTINSYRYRLFEKLKVKNDVEMMHVILRYGFLDQQKDHLLKSKKSRKKLTESITDEV